MSDSVTPEIERCPRCHAEFVPAASPLGLCPACLLKLGASDPGMKAPPFEIEAVATPEALASPPPRRTSRVWPRNIAMIAGAAVLVAAVAFWAWVRRPTDDARTPSLPIIRFTLALPDEADSVARTQFAISPDGSRIALAARAPDGQLRLLVRTLQSMDWRVLTGTEGARLPFWSPDGRQIGYFADRRLKKIEVSSGLTQTLCDAPSGRGGTWSRDGTIVFAPVAAGPLFRVSATGGTAEPLTTIDTAGGETGHAWPQFLPDSRSVLFVATAASDHEAAIGSGQAGLHVISLESGRRQLLVPGGGAGAFANGFLLFVRGQELWVQRFDPNQLEFMEDRRAISGAEYVGESSIDAGFTVSDAGVLVHRAGGSSQGQLTWFDRRGQAIGTIAGAADYQQLAISRDGRRIAASLRNPRDTSSNIWIIDRDRDVPSRLTLGASEDSSPLWLPDGRIAFLSVRAGTRGVYATDADGGGKEHVLLKSTPHTNLEDVSPDGRLLLYSTRTSAGSDVWLLTLGGDDKPQALLQTEFNESQGRLSPDGRWIAYVSDESGRDEVYVRAFPQADGRWQLSLSGGRLPRWRGDGRELFYLSPEGAIVAVDVAAGQEFRMGAPRMLFMLRHADHYDVGPDGQQFLAAIPTIDRRNGLQVVVNWQEELRNRQ